VDFEALEGVDDVNSLFSLVVLWIRGVPPPPCFGVKYLESMVCWVVVPIKYS